MTSPDEPPLYQHQLHDASVQPSPLPLELRANPPIAPSRLDHDTDFLNGIEEVAKDLDQLVHRLNRRPILQDSLRWHFLDDEGRGREMGGFENGKQSQSPKLDVYDAHTSIQQSQHLEPTPMLNPIPEMFIACAPCSSITPQPCDTLQPSGPMHSDRSVPDAALRKMTSDEKTAHRVNTDMKRSRRPTDVRLHKSASNLRMLGLVTGMVENGVQCNVHNSTPPSPTGALSTSSAIPASMRYIEPQDPLDSCMPDRMPLEIDMGFSELDEDTMLNDSLALRHASTPAGIRKFGFLRYRSSSEAAQSCKNMKKSVPRMRRRRRTNPPSTNGSTTSTSHPPSTA
ncbi:hypothetical protein NPX13_g1722 [Xylaria arbuscula]|uniref:Uncharacterized protein n=1 Tax=Xylaria arbuscula TaxID=114810 RepID=A0A9W8NM44_9PEZI|nr:hypothetical protein NPX13_g1722 [Xylaria arbuscula]